MGQPKFLDENKGSKDNLMSTGCHHKQSDFKLILLLLLFVVVNFALFMFSHFKIQELQGDLNNLKLTVENFKKGLVIDDDLLEEIKKFNNEEINSPLIIDDPDYDPEYDYDLFEDNEEKDSVENLNILIKPPISLTKIGNYNRYKRATSDVVTKHINTKPPIESDVQKNETEVTNLPVTTARRKIFGSVRRNDKTRSELKYKQPQLKSAGTAQWETIEDRTAHPDVTIVRDTEVHHRRNRHRQRNNFETLDERPHNRNKLFPAIHFNGDTSKYVLGLHTNFNGDGHLRHLNQRYIDWDSTNWVKNLGMDQHFLMTDGFLKIKENGLYFVYAQIYYLDEHDTNGYRVYKNSETLLQCTTMTHSKDRVLKGNTCYTAGMDYFVEGDQISLQDLADGRYSLFESGKSFFGLFKLGDIKVK